MKSWTKWVLGLAGLGAIIFAVLLAGRKIMRSPANLDNYKPGLGEGSAESSNSSNGISDTSLPKVFELNGAQIDQELKSEFVYGYILIGLQNGKVIYRPHLNDLQVTADWNHAILSFSTEGNRGYVYIPRLAIVNLKTHAKLEPTDAGQYFPLQFPEPYRWNFTAVPGVPCAFIKVLDREKETLLVGFKLCS